MKFGQGVYWGDGGWRTQIIGVMGGKRVAGSGGLGEWVGSGRLTAGGGEVAGRACPAPTGWRKGERVLVGNGQAEGSRPLPTMRGEAGCAKQ